MYVCSSVCLYVGAHFPSHTAQECLHYLYECICLTTSSNYLFNNFKVKSFSIKMYSVLIRYHRNLEAIVLIVLSLSELFK